MPNPTISVVVPAYNCQRTIAQTLRAILDQEHSKAEEVVAVDDGSTDQTAQEIKSFESVQYVHQDNAGPASARNRGVQESKGEVIFFTDSDCQPHPDWIEKMLVHLKDPQIAAVAGSYGIANRTNLLAFCIHKEIAFRHTFLMPNYPKAFGSYNFCIRREVFEKVGGFDINYPFASGEDNDLSYKVLDSGYKIYFEKSALVKHYHPESLKKYLKEQFRHGFFRVKMYKDHPRMIKGDDYTFWKDLVEIPLVLVIVLMLILSPLQLTWAPQTLLVCLLWLVFLEVYYGLRMMGALPQGLFLGGVMFLRSFFRTLGFSAGIASNFLHLRPKKSK